MDKTSSMYLYVKLNWDANRFLPAESKDCMNSASITVHYCPRSKDASWPRQRSRVKGRDLTQSYDKSLYTHRKNKKNQRNNIKNAIKNFDYTTYLFKI